MVSGVWVDSPRGGGLVALGAVWVCCGVIFSELFFGFCVFVVSV
jgi:hypothetical protein